MCRLIFCVKIENVMCFIILFRSENYMEKDNFETMDEENGLLCQIRICYEKFSKGQKKLADYILSNYEKAAFMTAVRLGEEVGVSESTVVRFAVNIGFDGFLNFQKELANLVQEKIHSIQRIEISAGEMTRDMVLDNVLNADAQKIKMTLEGLDRNAFQAAVDTILQADTIYVVGVRSCAPLAEFLSFYLKIIFPRVVLAASSNTSELFEQMLRVNENDVVIGISFPRYSMRTLKAMEYANNKNAKVIAITDSMYSPINLYSSCNLFARSDMASIVDSLVAPLSLINALIVALCMEKRDDVIDNLESLEKVWMDYQFNDSDEINLLDETVMMELKNI